MAAISTWSTTAASNNANPPDGWPENMAPSAVNDAAREMMASVRSWYEDAEWINLGYTHTYVAATQFRIAGTDYTAEYHVGRRVRVVAATPGTIYGTITASVFSTDTTITVAFDSGSLSSEALTVSLGALSGNASAIPGVKVSEDDWTFQGDVTVAGAATVTGAIAATGQITEGGSRVLLVGELATQANMEAEAAAKIATADRVKNSPGVAKGWCVLTPAAAILASYNVASITDTANARLAVNWTTNFSSANYVALGAAEVDNTTAVRIITFETMTAGSSPFHLTNESAAEAEANVSSISIVAHGDQ